MTSPRAVVTGVAGFVGSRLAERLLTEGYEVVGVDCFTPYYDRAVKRRNVDGLAGPAFQLVEADLRVDDVGAIVAGADLVFHQAAQTGVRGSWSDGFLLYDQHNVLGTQRLLEACRDVKLQRFVYASSSSVYGNAQTYPCTEGLLPQPHSPYGVTKLAGEHLTRLYASNWAIPTVALRYFTVYGGHQRPDMAIYRLIDAALTGNPFPLYGDGSHVRDFTHVSDVVSANLAAAVIDTPPGTVVNVAGGSSVQVRALIEAVESSTDARVSIERLAEQPGDVRRTGAAINRAAELLGWRPVVGLETGLLEQVAWQRAARDAHRSAGVEVSGHA